MKLYNLDELPEEQESDLAEQDLRGDPMFRDMAMSAMMDILKRKWGENSFNVGTSNRASIYTLNIANPFK